MLFLGLTLSLAAQAQTKPTLALLPFSGKSSGDTETVMILLANQERIRNAFTVIPAHTNFSDIIQALQSRDSDTANGDDVKKSFNADFVIIVHTEVLADSNLVIIDMVNTETLQLLAGDYQKYHEIRALRTALPDIAQKMINALQGDTGLPKLAVLPFYTPASGGVETTLLTRLLAIAIAESGKYALFPWAATINPGSTGLTISYSGIIDADSVKAIGRIINAGYVLVGDALNLRGTNLVMAFILNTDDAGLLSEGEIEYTVVTDDLAILSELAQVLTKTSAPIQAAASIPTAERDIPAGDTEDSLKRLVTIGAGVFTMGSPGSEISRDPDEIQHQVMMSSFYMGKYEVTQQEYEAVMETNPSRFKGAHLPVEQVSWFDAVLYCNARSIKEGLKPAYTITETEVTWNHNANGYRLPTEAEWEYACRAGTATAFNTGNNFITDQGNYDGNYPYNGKATGLYRTKTTVVGNFTPNAWDLYDMHGNVYEWCWDQYKPAYSTEDLNGSIDADAVIRGGSWYSEARFLRSANRAHAAHRTRTSYIGFRVVRSDVAN
jgi:formylglycine-generating enzyme required for sulfatase activity